MLLEQQARADAEMGRRLVERDTLHRDATDRLLAQVALERAMWTERIDAAELRAEQTNAMLADLVGRIMATIPAPAPASAPPTEPWWRRWFGTSSRSKLS